MTGFSFFFLHFGVRPFATSIFLIISIGSSSVFCTVCNIFKNSQRGIALTKHVKLGYELSPILFIECNFCAFKPEQWGGGVTQNMGLPEPHYSAKRKFSGFHEFRYVGASIAAMFSIMLLDYAQHRESKVQTPISVIGQCNARSRKHSFGPRIISGFPPGHY